MLAFGDPLWLNSLKEVRMVAYLSQLHQKVQIVFLLVLGCVAVLE
jgi:hypothetical protein